MVKLNIIDDYISNPKFKKIDGHFKKLEEKNKQISYKFEEYTNIDSYTNRTINIFKQIKVKIHFNTLNHSQRLFQLRKL